MRVFYQNVFVIVFIVLCQGCGRAIVLMPFSDILKAINYRTQEQANVPRMNFVSYRSDKGYEPFVDRENEGSLEHRRFHVNVPPMRKAWYHRNKNLNAILFVGGDGAGVPNICNVSQDHGPMSYLQFPTSGNVKICRKDISTNQGTADIDGCFEDEFTRCASSCRKTFQSSLESLLTLVRSKRMATGLIVMKEFFRPPGSHDEDLNQTPSAEESTGGGQFFFEQSTSESVGKSVVRKCSNRAIVKQKYPQTQDSLMIKKLLMASLRFPNGTSSSGIDSAAPSTTVSGTSTSAAAETDDIAISTPAVIKNDVLKQSEVADAKPGLIKRLEDAEAGPKVLPFRLRLLSARDGLNVTSEVPPLNLTVETGNAGKGSSEKATDSVKILGMISPPPIGGIYARKPRKEEKLDFQEPIGFVRSLNPVNFDYFYEIGKEATKNSKSFPYQDKGEMSRERREQRRDADHTTEDPVIAEIFGLVSKIRENFFDNILQPFGGLSKDEDLEVPSLLRNSGLTLKAATEDAIRKMKHRDRGFLLIVDGGKVNSKEDAKCAGLDEVSRDLSDAVEVAKRETLGTNTLIVVARGCPVEDTNIAVERAEDALQKLKADSSNATELLKNPETTAIHEKSDSTMAPSSDHLSPYYVSGPNSYLFDDIETLGSIPEVIRKAIIIHSRNRYTHGLYLKHPERKHSAVLFEIKDHQSPLAAFFKDEDPSFERDIQANEGDAADDDLVEELLM